MEQEAQRILDSYERREGRSRADFFGYQGLGHLVRIQDRHRRTLQLLQQFGFTNLSKLRVLDVGCGSGELLLQLAQWGADPARLAGIDLREQPVARARQLNPHMDVRCGNASSLPWPSSLFDLVCQHTVFTSILDPALRLQIASEMTRVLRPGGAVLWYDFLYDNPRNPDVRGAGAKEIRDLFPSFDVHLSKVTLAPFIERRLPQLGLPIWYWLLTSLPPLRTHCLALLVKAGEIVLESPR